jgi:hypothetical protein
LKNQGGDMMDYWYGGGYGREYKQAGVVMMRDNYWNSSSFTRALFSYKARAVVAGKFVVPPATSEEMYIPDATGRSEFETIKITEKSEPIPGYVKRIDTKLGSDIYYKNRVNWNDLNNAHGIKKGWMVPKRNYILIVIEFLIVITGGLILAWKLRWLDKIPVFLKDKIVLLSRKKTADEDIVKQMAKHDDGGEEEKMEHEV